MLVEPMGLILDNPRGQDIGLPRARRRLEAFELGEHRREESEPCIRAPGSTRCHSKRKRSKSRAGTGSISARSRLTV